jgi:hypothetical protein
MGLGPDRNHVLLPEEIVLPQGSAGHGEGTRMDYIISYMGDPELLIAQT